MFKIVAGHLVPLEETMIFETMYHENLQFSLEEKSELFLKGVRPIYLMKDYEGDLPTKSNLVGETYGIDMDCLEEPIEGITEDLLAKFKATPLLSAYVYSTTIITPYQNMGLGKIIKAALLGYYSSSSYQHVFGHCRNGASMSLNQYFGADMIQHFDDWYGTGERYWLYHLKLGVGK